MLQTPNLQACEPISRGPGKILTKRENQVFEMLTQGHSNAEIAEELFHQRADRKRLMSPGFSRNLA